MSESGAIVGKLRVLLGLDDSKYKKGLGGAEGDAEKSGSKIGGTFGRIGKALGTAVVGGVAVAGAAIAGLTAKSLNLFADYEQLVGGIDTLFKGSSETLQGYADDAFMTAGISSNKYMETVTSFSASLISSLGGDTEKAVEFANSAIIDMSDNANKMGSSMESIQDAYQGFAKQNFTMLDNLKLGYGGTKTEMERLLSDASKISGIEYNVDSFSDVTAAIHIMQEEMGIAGATAEEAEGTISGSIGSMKASFENLLIGLGDPGANIKKLTDNVVGAFGNVIANITPIIENILQAMPTMISGILDAIIEILPSIIDAIASFVPVVIQTILQIIPVLAGLIPLIVDTIVSNLPALIDAAIQIVFALIEGIIEAIPILAAAIPQLIETIVETITDLFPMLIESAINILLALVDGIIGALPFLIEAIPTIIETIVRTLIQYLPQIIDAAVEILMAIVNALIDNAPLLFESIGAIAAILLKGIMDLVPQLWDAGKNLIAGLIEGMKDFNIFAAIASIAGSIIAGFKDAFGISSPAKKMGKEVGKFLMPGITDALPSGIPNAISAIDSAVGSMFGGLNSPAMAGAGAGGGGISITIENINLANGSESEAERAGQIIGKRVVSAVSKARSRGM